MISVRAIILAAICLISSGTVGAEQRTVWIPAAYAVIAEEFDVPAGLLYAVGKAESNAKFSGKPWPWTLNVRGESMYFRTKKEASAYLTELLSSGEQQVDVGLMQINWRWHKEKLITPDVALSPYYNLRVGAAYLREHYDASGDWFIAVGRYHSPGNPVRGDAYAKRVLAHWEALSR